jgi:hypothetical protein
MAENLVERYLTDLAEIHGTRSNVPETSFYPALERLLTDVGRSLSPKVRCVVHPASRGAGLPDGGLFTADQFRRKTRDSDAQADPFQGQNPSRGVIEAKGPSDDVSRIVETEQVEKYWKRYGMVLVTNFRAFALVGKDASGQPRVLESFSLADSESEFWRLASHPRKAATEHGERMLEYLRRVLLHNAPLAKPEDVAALLASYAHDARLRIEQVDLPALASLRQALEDALGLRFEGHKGDHFFRSTLVQTLFYGVFSAWVLWSRHRDAKPSGKAGFAETLREGTAPYDIAGPFDWRSAHWLLRVPMLRGLFVQVADPGRLGALGLIEILDWTAAALNRVDRAEFFQYFYEPFLQAFDPELRKELGVWYTPEEIVRYQVERVDAVLRTELGLADGLADPKVVVLDPCCGTGAYLRAVLRRIAVTLHDKGGDALVANDLKKAAMERVFGFEILPAPFVIAHLQLGLELETLGAPLSDLGDPPERAGVYLTNALTGWTPPKEKPKQIAFAGFDEERDAAAKVKQEKPILVILGNPPYNAFAGVSPEEENDLVEPYKNGLISEWGIKKFNLDDLYIRFFRLAEKCVAEHRGRGVVSFISNNSWTTEPSFVVLRRHLLNSFDRFWIENMHGNRKISEYAPDGRTSETVFAIPGFSVGIQQGVAISLWVKHRERDGEPVVRFHDNIADAKAVERRAHLLASLKVRNFDGQYRTATPTRENRWSFRPSEVSDQYLCWPSLVDLCAEGPWNGLMEKRGGALIDSERVALEMRMRRYYEKETGFEALAREGHPLAHSAARYDAKSARCKLLESGPFCAENVRRFALRPFEHRWCFATTVRPIWNEPRPRLQEQCWAGNVFLLSRPSGVAHPEGVPFYLTRGLGDNDLLRGHAYYFAFHLKIGGSATAPRDTQQARVLPGLGAPDRVVANLSSAARAYLALLECPDPDRDDEGSELIWLHALAIGYAPAYLSENADGIRQNWPRIPLPARNGALLASVAFGRLVAALLDVETAVPGVTAGAVPDDLRGIGVFERLDGKPAKPEAGDLDLTAGWGHGGKGGITMPGRGKVVERDDGAYDVLLNDVACWRNVPEAVWEYTIGGYQVIKKWLSYREKSLLGRGLTPEEVRYVTEMARRIAALVAMQPVLDDNYRAVVAETYPWVTSAPGAG